MERIPTSSAAAAGLPPDWTDQVIIRTMVQSDLPGLEWDGEYRHFRRVYAGAFERARQGLSVLWVAELPGHGIIGQVFIQLTADRHDLANGSTRAYLYSFRLRPQYRNHGIGRRMMSILEDDLRQRYFKFVTLNVAKDNWRARALYEREGYHVVGEEDGIWSYPDHKGIWHRVEEPAWRMEKKIS